MISNKRWVLLTLGVVWFALLRPGFTQQYALQSYDRKAGLQSLTISSLAQDDQGFLWVGTEAGLYRFDGSGFERMGTVQGFEPGAYVTDLEEHAGSGRLWVATQSGLVMGDGRHFSRVEPQGKPLVVDIGHQMVALDDGRLLLVRGNQLMELSRAAVGAPWQLHPAFVADQLVSQPALRNISSVYRLGGHVWLGCDTSLCEMGDDGRVTRHGPGQGVPSDVWTGMVQDRQGTLWMRGVHHVLVRPAGASRFISRDVPAALMGVVNDSGSLVQDPRGRVLTATNRGLARWDGATWQLIDSRNGLPSIGITALLFDQGGALWLGTYGRGVSRWNGYGKIEGWGITQGLDSVPNWSILRSGQGALWFGNELGGSVLVDGHTELQPWPLKFVPAPRQVLAMARGADGAIWVGLYDHRALRYDPASGRTTLAAMLPTFVKVLLVDRAGRLWIGTVNGIYRIDHAGAAAQLMPIEQTTGQQCSDIAESADGTIWFACNEGVLRFAGEHWTKMQAEPQMPISGFSAVTVDDDGSLWLGANEPGVVHAQVQGDRLQMAAIEDPTLQSTLVYFIRRDHRGWIWVGGGSGVDVFDGQRWTHLSRDDGLLWDETAQNSFFEDRDGSVWLGSSVGVSHILDPEAVMVAGTPKVVITSVMQGAQSLGEGASIHMDRTRPALTINYALPAHASGSVPRFRYRLNGAGWITTASRSINLTNLPADAYRLEIQAVDDDHRSVSASAGFDFVVPPPWWNTWWSYLVATGLLAVTVVLGWRWYSRRLRSRNQRLETMVVQRTAELTLEKQALESTRAQLYHQATYDSLTGLLNRKAVLDQIETMLARHRPASAGLAVGLIDADHFKRVNDTFGHQAGDATLKAIAAHLLTLLRADDLLGRYGGEEMLLVLSDITQSAAEQRLQAIQTSASLLRHHWGDQHFNVTLSIGMVWLGPEPAAIEEIVRRADTALYQAKWRGRNQVVVAPMNSDRGGERSEG